MENSTGKRLVYYTDCKRVPREAVEFAKGADVVILDGLRPDPHPSHMSIGEAIAVSGEIGAPRNYLIHLTHLTDHGSMEATMPASVSALLRRAANYSLVKAGVPSPGRTDSVLVAASNQGVTVLITSLRRRR